MQEDAAHGGPACTPFGSAHGLFDRGTYELRLPSFLQEHASTPHNLHDSGGVRYFGSGSHPDPDLWRANLHLLYLNNPELCKKCSCTGECGCPTYTDLWEQFLEATGQSEASKVDLAEQINEWHSWAEVQHREGRLTAAQVQLCSGPCGRAEVYDRAMVGEVSFTCTRLEESKLAKDSIVLMRHQGELCAGRVTAFLSHLPPGWDDRGQEPDIAVVSWYAWVPDDQPSMEPSLDCPLFGQRLLKNDPTGNMCLVQQLLPCKLAAVPYRYQARNQVAIISRFADFWKDLP